MHTQESGRTPEGPTRDNNFLRIHAIELATDTLTPVSAFHRLGLEGGDAFLCEGVTEGQTSAESGQVPSRYSILGFDPYRRFRLVEGKLSIEEFKGGEPSLVSEVESSHPFRELERELLRFKVGSGDYGPTLFDAGFSPQACAVGFVGYDSVAYMERITLPDASHEPHGFPDACLVVFRNLLVFDHVRSRVRLIHLTFGEDPETAKTDAIIAKLNQEGAPPKPIRLDVESEPLEVNYALGKTRFFGAMKTMKGHIRAGDVFQGVVSERMRVGLKSHPFQVYRALRMLNPSPYHYYFATGDLSIVGASPEMLIKIAQNGVIETCPIAGTRPRGKDFASDRKMEKQLLASIKEKAEHLMLVDLARNDLGRVSEPGTVRVSEFMRVRRFSHVMHLVSTVQGKLESSRSPWEALVATFPAGTLTGAPKIRAMQIISKLEPVRRGPYGGAFVLYDFSGRLDSAITIRTMFVSKRGAFVQAGAGIVADSRPEMEYQEILNKARPVLRAIELAHASGARS